MIAFAGYSMPLQYNPTGPIAARCAGGVLAEHRHCRNAAALFDVSHMGQAILSGTAAPAALESLVPGDIVGLKPGRSRYTLLTNEAGGIIDDLIVLRLAEDRLGLVLNASRKELDLRHIAAAVPPSISLVPLDEYALLALQGPQAAAVLGRLCPEAPGLAFMAVAQLSVGGIQCQVSRSGYTGEDGFEISVPANRAEALADRLLAEPEVALAGLGARDSLRLEAGLCLYGNDIDELTTPIEAGLVWTIGKRRRASWDFPGGRAIRDQIETGPPRLRVGLRPDGRAPARAGAAIVAGDGTEAGVITSGGFSPTFSSPIAMGYVRRDLSAIGTSLYLLVRDKPLAAKVAQLPFVPHRYAH